MWFQHEEDNFSIGFSHRCPENCAEVETYYAFTYPFSYTECQEMMTKFDIKYGKSNQDTSYIINRLLQACTKSPIPVGKNSKCIKKIKKSEYRFLF